MRGPLIKLIFFTAARFDVHHPRSRRGEKGTDPFNSPSSLLLK
jgi:hypothetical protein